MNIELFDYPKIYGTYLQVGTYETHPIFVGDKPPKDWVAMATDDGNGVCINEVVYEALKRSPDLLVFLENICEHELSSGPVHEHQGERPMLDKKIIQYLRQQGILK